MTMPRSLQEILDHAEELERRFETHEPADVRDAAPLRALRDAVTDRAATERRIAETVAAAREAGVSWSAIGGMVSLAHSGDYSTAEVADLFGVGRSTVYRAIERQRNEARAGLTQQVAKN
jgi:DNA invertase Pin-like site-specific DNA recombinase